MQSKTLNSQGWNMCGISQWLQLSHFPSSRKMTSSILETGPRLEMKLNKIQHFYQVRIRSAQESRPRNEAIICCSNVGQFRYTSRSRHHNCQVAVSVCQHLSFVCVKNKQIESCLPFSQMNVSTFWSIWPVIFCDIHCKIETSGEPWKDPSHLNKKVFS